jgi:hypothetical protein
MTEKKKELRFDSLDAVIKHFNAYDAQILDYTGHHPKAPIGPLDVVKIVKRVFFDKNESARPPEGDAPK